MLPDPLYHRIHSVLVSRTSGVAVGDSGLFLHRRVWTIVHRPKRRPNGAHSLFLHTLVAGSNIYFMTTVRFSCAPGRRVVGHEAERPVAGQVGRVSFSGRSLPARPGPWPARSSPIILALTRRRRCCSPCGVLPRARPSPGRALARVFRSRLPPPFGPGARPLWVSPPRPAPPASPRPRAPRPGPPRRPRRAQPSDFPFYLYF